MTSDQPSSASRPLRELRHRLVGGGEIRPMTALLLTIATAAMLVGGGMAFGYLAGGFMQPSQPVMRRVEQDVSFFGAVAGGGLWLLVLIAVLRPVKRLRRHRSGGRPGAPWKPLIIVGVTAVVVTTAGVLSDILKWDDNELFVMSTAMAGFGVAIIAWAPYVFAKEHLGPPTDPSELVCLDCGYSMVGLSSAVCPECGRRHTLEELLSRPE